MPGRTTRNLGNNSVVSEWKENFRLSQPTPSLFWRHFVSRCRGNKQLLNHFLIMNVPGIVAPYKWLGIRYRFSVNANESECSKIGESGNL